MVVFKIFILILLQATPGFSLLAPDIKSDNEPAFLEHLPYQHPGKSWQVSPKSRPWIQKENVNKTNNLLEYLGHIKQRGYNSFKCVGDQLIKGGNSEQEVKELINNVADDYVSKIHNYLEYMLTRKSEFVFDQDVILIDIAEVACRLIYREHRKLLKYANIKVGKSELEDSSSVEDLNDFKYRKINESVQKENINLRKEEMHYICQKYNVCRLYPAFSHYCGHFLTEMLKLPNRKFEIFARIGGMIFRLNTDITLLISAIKSNTILTSEIDAIVNNVTKIKEALKILKEITTQHFNIIRSTNIQLSLRAPAIRMLLDFLDKAFDADNHEDFVIAFERTIVAIKQWSHDRIPSVSKVLAEFIHSMFQTLMSLVRKDELGVTKMVVLIEMIRGGNSTHGELLNILSRHELTPKDFYSDSENLLFTPIKVDKK